MDIVTAHTLAGVTRWLDQHPGSLGVAVLSVGIHPRTAGPFQLKTFALGDPEDNALTISAQNPELIKTAIISAHAQGRRLYAHQARDISWALEPSTKMRMTILLCTMVAAQTVYPGRAEGYSLASLRPAAGIAMNRLRTVAKASPNVPMKSWLPSFLAREDAQHLAIQDAVATFAVETAVLARETMLSGLGEQVQARLEVEQVWRWQGYDGIRMDRVATQTAANRLRVQATMAKRSLGFDPMDPNAAKRWAGKSGVHLPTTAAGQPTLSRATLSEAVVPDSATAQWATFLKARNLGSFSGKLTELLDAADAESTLYPEIRIFTDNASTGRMSVSKPALQNLANAELENSTLSTLRNCLIASPGKVLVSCDLAHVEPSVLAAVSDDEALKAAVAPGADVYVETAVVLWGEKARTDKSLRARAKTILLALLYGKGDTSLAVDLGGTVAEAGAAKAALLGSYPRMAVWVRTTLASAKAGETLLTASGRPVANRGPQDAYKAVNYLIQGTASDVLCEMTVAVADELDESFPTARLWLPVHDELVIECDEKDAEAVRSLLETCMTTTLNGVPIWGEAKILGSTWTK